MLYLKPQPIIKYLGGFSYSQVVLRAWEAVAEGGGDNPGIWKEPEYPHVLNEEVRQGGGYRYLWGALN